MKIVNLGAVYMRILNDAQTGTWDKAKVLFSPLAMILVFSATAATHLPAAPPKADVAALKKALTFHASFDEAVRADVGRGEKTPSTRFNHETEKGAFVFAKGFDPKVFRIARGKGISGGALECTDVLPRNGRIFFPAKDNLAFKKGGWSGSMSFWINTDPNQLLKTKFCDPVQITQKGANNGGIWVDFNDAKPRATCATASSPPSPRAKLA